MKVTKDHHITNYIEVSTTSYTRQVPRFCLGVGDIIFYHKIVVTSPFGANVIVKENIQQIAFHVLVMLVAWALHHLTTLAISKFSNGSKHGKVD